MSQIYKSAAFTPGVVDSVTGTNGVTASPTSGNVVVSGVDATTSTVGVASFNPVDFTVTAGVVTLINPPGSIPWSDKAVSFLAVSNHGYFCTAVLTATMPAAPSEGDIVFIISTVPTLTGVVTLQANTGQFFRVGTDISVIAGTCASSKIGDAIEFVYRAADSVWYCANSPQGTWSVT